MAKDTLPRTCAESTPPRGLGPHRQAARLQGGGGRPASGGAPLVTDHAGASAYRLADLPRRGPGTPGPARPPWVPPRDLLPEVAAATDLAGQVTGWGPRAATGLLAGTPVVGRGRRRAGQSGRGRGHPGTATLHVSLGTAVYFGVTLWTGPARRPGSPARRLSAHMDPKPLHPVAGDRHRRRGPGLGWSACSGGGRPPPLGTRRRSTGWLGPGRLDTDGSLLFAPWLSAGSGCRCSTTRALRAVVRRPRPCRHGPRGPAAGPDGGGRLPDALGAGSTRRRLRGADRRARGRRRRGASAAAWTQIIADVRSGPWNPVSAPPRTPPPGARPPAPWSASGPSPTTRSSPTGWR